MGLCSIGRSRTKGRIRISSWSHTHGEVVQLYFDGNVKSLANSRHGARFSVGIISPGEYRFGTEAAERMNVTCGEILVKQDGAEAFTCYPQGTCWEVAPKSGFTVKVALPAAYYCQYL